MNIRLVALYGSIAACICTTGLGCSSILPSSTTNTPANQNDSVGMPTPEVVTIKPLPGFKVYQNKTEGFAIQYPESWTVREKNFNTIVSFLSPLTNNGKFVDKFAENVNIVSQKIDDKNITLDQYYKYSEDNLKLFFKDFKLIKNEATTLSGVPARMVIYNATQELSTPAGSTGATKPDTGTGAKISLRTTQIFTLKNNKAYIITLTNTQNDPNQYMSEMLKISQSFQFLP
jgi:serine/threonine-protein kinase